MATHSSTLAWKISGTGEPGGLQSMGLHRVGHDRSDLAASYLTAGEFILTHHLQQVGGHSDPQWPIPAHCILCATMIG